MSKHWDHIAGVIGFDPRRHELGVADAERDYPQRAGVARRLDELCLLAPGWDGYQGRAVTAKTAARVHALLAACLSPAGRYPSIVPGSSGDVQVEWHRGGVDLEIGITEEEHVTFSFAYGDADPEGISGTIELKEPVTC
ncbi:hypothetical protein HFO56_33230 [Rhizobium laguerreae]|uniref:hypothetical protein n=1 Tax=Rhizobium laguerreae TaxID=1076926 RepID=UPI001C90B93D|nr:hypothetical protein [Rhizobium laguerreae]MBY3157189.1 hypothetical protein [Rhizobium laguerreae]